jgi:hypothetical protein
VNLSKKSFCSCSLCQPWAVGRLSAACHAVRHVWSPDRAERINPVKRLWHNGSGSAAEDVQGAPAIRGGFGAQVGAALMVL